jgi:hypothetical protein
VRAPRISAEVVRDGALKQRGHVSRKKVLPEVTFYDGPYACTIAIVMATE